jgi:hypothetical protein
MESCYLGPWQLLERDVKVKETVRPLLDRPPGRRRIVWTEQARAALIEALEHLSRETRAEAQQSSDRLPSRQEPAG